MRTAKTQGCPKWQLDQRRQRTLSLWRVDPQWWPYNVWCRVTASWLGHSQFSQFTAHTTVLCHIDSPANGFFTPSQPSDVSQIFIEVSHHLVASVRNRPKICATPLTFRRKSPFPTCRKPQRAACRILYSQRRTSSITSGKKNATSSFCLKAGGSWFFWVLIRLQKPPFRVCSRDNSLKYERKQAI